MCSRLKILTLVVTGLILCGCIEKKQELTLNPDGSGKVVFEIKQPLESKMAFNMGGAKKAKETPEEKAKKAVSDILKNSKGIDAWEDVSYKVDSAKNLIIKGTAFFKSFNDFQIGSMSSDQKLRLKLKKDQMTLTWGRENKKKSESAPNEKLSKEDLAKKVDEAQAKLKQGAGMIAMMLKGFKDEAIIHLPGKIEKIKNFEKVNDNTVSLTITGEKALKVIQDYANDKKAIAKTIKAGRDPQKDGPKNSYLNKKLFGNSKKPLVRVSELKVIFDYEKSVKAALKAYPDMTKKLGIDLPKPVILPEVKGKVTGTVNGEAFALEQAYIQNGILHLRQGKDFFADKEFVIFLFLKKDEKLDGKKYKVTEKSGFGSPHVHVKYKIAGEKMPKTEMFMSKYTMNLEFGKVKDGAITGKISLQVPDAKKSNIAGEFAAEMKK